MRADINKIMQGFRCNPIASACGVIVFALLFVFYFRSGALGEAQVKLDAGNKAYQGLKNNLTASMRLEEDVRRLSAINSRTEVGLLHSSELAQNQQLFYKIEAETGVKLVDLRQQALASPPKVVSAKGKGAPAKTEAANVYVLLDFSVTLEGEYEATLLFMKQLDRSPVLSKVATISSSKMDSGHVTMTMNLQVVGLP